VVQLPLIDRSVGVEEFTPNAASVGVSQRDCVSTTVLDELRTWDARHCWSTGTRVYERSQSVLKVEKPIQLAPPFQLTYVWLFVPGNVARHVHGFALVARMAC